jgi:nucleoside-diphosphate-sugar epimerase
MSQQQNIKTVIVTGAAGYIGGAICIELTNQGYRVIGVDKRTSHHLKPY